MNSKFARFTIPITAILFCLLWVQHSKAQPADIKPGPQFVTQHGISDLVITEDIIEQLSNPDFPRDGSIETKLLRLNPSFSKIIISPGQRGVDFEFVKSTPMGNKKLNLSADSEMWRLTKKADPPISTQERITGWLKMAQQPHLLKLERVEQNGATVWKVNAQFTDIASMPKSINETEASQQPKDEEFSEKISSSSLISHFKKGGFIMYLILLCSVGGLYITLERAYILRRSRLIPDKFVQDVLQKVSAEESEKYEIISGVIDMCEDKDLPAARTLKAGLMVYSEGILGVKTAISSANAHEGAIMERGVGLLGVFANIYPLLGLLGTVTGMIKAFEMISVGGTGRPEVVANGISEALITTAGGLFVGIPLLLLYFFFQGKIDDILIDLEEFSLEVVEKILVRSK